MKSIPAWAKDWSKTLYRYHGTSGMGLEAPTLCRYCNIAGMTMLSSCANQWIQTGGMLDVLSTLWRKPAGTGKAKQRKMTKNGEPSS
jgi:hypothetical protein